MASGEGGDSTGGTRDVGEDAAARTINDVGRWALLRAAVNGDAAAVAAAALPHDVLMVLQDAQRSVAAVLAAEPPAGWSDRAPAALWEQGNRVWDALARLDERTHRYALPPRHFAPELEANFRAFAANLAALERGYRHVGFNRIYSGPRGTGKTTLLRCVGSIAAVLLRNTLPVHWSYEVPWPGCSECGAGACRFPSLNTLWRCATHAFRGSSGSGDMQPLLLIDEFTELYADGDAATTAVGADIMTRLHYLCKSRRNVYALLTASRTRMERFTDRDCEYRRLGFPAINCTIFRDHIMKPIRDAAALAAFVAARYPGRAPIDAATLLEATGGVARHVAAVMAAPAAAVPHAYAGMHPAALVASRGLFAVFSALLRTLDNYYGNHDPFPALLIRGVVDMLQTRLGVSAAAATAVIDGWCDDDSVLWRTSGMLEVLVPASVHRFKAHVEADDTLRVASALAATLYPSGIHCYHPANDAIVGALITSAIHRHDAIRMPRCREEPLTLCDRGVGVAGVATSLDDCLQCVMPWRVLMATGRYRDDAHNHLVWLEEVVADGDAAAGGRCVVVHSLQFVIGALGGVLSADSLATLRAPHNPSLDANTLAGNLVAAERAYGTLLRCLRAAFPCVTTWRLGTHHIFTTLAADDACRGAHPNPHTIITPKSAPGGGSGTASFRWVIHAGSGWLAAILPPAVAALAL